MRIAFHVPRASHLKPGLSGDRVFVANLLAGLRERGHQVKIVSRVNVRDFWRGRLPIRRLVTEAIRVRKEMKRFSPDAWLVYGTSVKNPDLFGWWQRPRSHVLFAADAGRGKRLPGWWRWLFRSAHRRSLARADKIVAYHPSGADQLRTFGVPEERLCVLPLAIKPWDWVPSREESKRRLGLPQEAPVILCVSRFTLREDDGRPGKTGMILDLVTALAALPSDVVLVLVGDGPGRQRLEDEAARLAPEGRVRFFGPVEHDDVRWFYAACDFFAYPYLTDRPWLTILEAQACGRPVVTIHTRSAELTVDAGRTGLLAKDLDEFQTHISALASDRGRCESMGRSAREYVARFHSIEARVKQIEDLLLGRPPGL